jgi:LysR family transcriptional regulator, cys regulon transcriptional activator
MSALDADVIKAYVELERGICITASMAFSPERDPQLRLLVARHLFTGNTSRVAVRCGSYLRSYFYRFIELCSPKLDEPRSAPGLRLAAMIAPTKISLLAVF